MRSTTTAKHPGCSARPPGSACRSGISTLTDPALAALYRHRLVLVRPDLHVAASGTDATDAADIIASVRGMHAATAPADVNA